MGDGFRVDARDRQLKFHRRRSLHEPGRSDLLRQLERVVLLEATTTDQPRALLLRLDERLLDEASKNGSPARPLRGDELLKGIVATAAASAAARHVPGVFVVRTGQLALAVLGTLDAAAEARVQALFGQIQRMLDTWVHVDYRCAEHACVRLAEQLAKQVPASLLDEATYVAVPRGGHIVLGMLATTAALTADQVGTMAGGPERPVVVVDDCSLTGDRFARWLRTNDKRRVVFAPLYAHPDLRTAVAAAEPRVVACVAAHDLEADVDGAQSPAWKGRVGGHRYWTGSPAFLSFAWKEPDRSLYNPVTARMEPGWHTVPPTLCLGNRHAATSTARVQIQLPAPGPLRPPDGVIFGDVDGELVVANAESGRAIGLSGTGALMWQSIVARGSVHAAVDDLLRAFDAPPEQLEADTRHFVDSLIARGLLAFV